MLAVCPGLGSFKSTESRRPSFANELHRLTPHTGLQEMKQAENDVDVVSDDNSSMHGERHFESSYDHDSRNAAEKHAYLHSQHGIDDSVF